MVVIGLDVHKDSIAAAVIDNAGRQLAGATFDNTDLGHAALQNWTLAYGSQLRIGMEPSGGIARQLAYHLEVAGHVVVQVQPRLSEAV